MALATDYDIVPLDTSTFKTGQAFAIYRGQVAGGSFPGAGYWPTPTQRIDLNPSGYQNSGAFAIWGAQQGGAVLNVDHNFHAALWTGSAASFIDLNPGGTGPNTGYSSVLGMYGNQQVGYSGSDAALWTGTAKSFVRLTPGNFADAMATGVYGGMQVGYGDGPQGVSAVVWHGTAASAVVLAGAARAFGISRGQVVGLVGAGGTNHAALWAGGTPAGFQDLSPAGTTASELVGTNGTQQVGDISIAPAFPGALPLDHEPAVWRGTGGSMQMLPLPQGDNTGLAKGIDGYGNIAGIVGFGNNGAFGQQAPVLWVPQRVPGDADFDGIVNFSDLLVLAQHYGKTGEWVEGDFNLDGQVNFSDLLILAQNYGQSRPSGVTYSIEAVPEPSAAGVVAAALLACRRRRRRGAPLP